MPSTPERDARLADVAAAVTAFVKKRRDELTLRVTTAKRILKGRTGADRLAQSAATGVHDLVVDDLNSFLTGK